MRKKRQSWILLIFLQYPDGNEVAEGRQDVNRPRPMQEQPRRLRASDLEHIYRGQRSCRSRSKALELTLQTKQACQSGAQSARILEVITGETQNQSYIAVNLQDPGYNLNTGRVEGIPHTARGRVYILCGHPVSRWMRVWKWITHPPRSRLS